MPSDLSRELREAAEKTGKGPLLINREDLLSLLDKADAAEGLAEAAEAIVNPPWTHVAMVPLRDALASFRAQEAE